MRRSFLSPAKMPAKDRKNTERGDAVQEPCKILIVEDEYIMQQGIRHLIDWEQEGFQIVGCATNGKEGLQLVEQLQPHIVLTDVVMPVMNGVELTRVLRERYPTVQVVVLSGYSDFEYVRDTFQGGAVDYILKSLLHPQSLLDTLRRVAGRIPGMVLKRGTATPEALLGNIIAGYGCRDVPPELKKELPFSRFFLMGTCAVRILGEDRDVVSRHERLLSASAGAELAEYPHRQLLTEKGVLLLVVNFEPARESLALEALRRTAKEISRSEPLAFYVVSTPFSSLTELRSVYFGPFLKSAESFFYHKGEYFLALETPQFSSKEDGGEVKAVKLDSIRFHRALADSQMSDALGTLQEFVTKALENRSMEELEFKSVVQNSLYQIITWLEDRVPDPIDLADLKRECLTQLQACPYAENFSAAFSRIVGKLAVILDAYGVRSQNDTMKSILNYIDTSYMEPITLQSIAQQFNFSYSYLSSYFRAHSSDGFSDYLNKVRIAHAQELFQKSALAPADVCGAVGYGDQSYFTKVFKKYAGCTPGEYRRRVTKGEIHRDHRS